MNLENYQERVLDVVHREHFEYMSSILTGSLSHAWEKTYESCYKNEILNVLESTEFTDEVYKKLLKQDNILDYLYGEWMKADCSVCEMLEDIIERVVK